MKAAFGQLFIIPRATVNLREHACWVLGLWDVGLSLCVSLRWFGEGYGGTCCSVPYCTNSAIVCPLQEWRFPNQKLGHVILWVCQPSTQSLCRLESFPFWVTLSLFRAYGTDYMWPAGFYKALGVITLVAGVLLRKSVKKMNVGDLCGMTLERYLRLRFF